MLNIKMKAKNIVQVCLTPIVLVACVLLGSQLPKYLESNEEIVQPISIERFDFPLPEKYCYSISSAQGLRKSIPNAGIGGEGTLNTYHNAIDFAVPIRTPVYSAKGGTVINVYPSYDNGVIRKGHPSYGGMIEIQHDDGTRTLYAHLIRTDVREGDIVDKGVQIGLSGGKRGMRGSGNSTGPHLHFAVYLDIQYAFGE